MHIYCVVILCIFCHKRRGVSFTEGIEGVDIVAGNMRDSPDFSQGEGGPSFDGFCLSRGLDGARRF